MGDTEDDEGGSLDDLGERGDGDQVGGQLDVGKVSRVLVLLVHELSELALAGNLDHRSEKETVRKRRVEERKGRDGEGSMWGEEEANVSS